MVSGKHLLPYDGVEQGVMRVNPELSYGRELVDAYARLLPVNKCVPTSAVFVHIGDVNTT
jgi:hypothetical protein